MGVSWAAFVCSWGGSWLLGSSGVLLGPLKGFLAALRTIGGLLGSTLGLRGVSLGHFFGCLLRRCFSLLFEALGDDLGLHN